MENILVGRLDYFFDKRGLIATYQNGKGKEDPQWMLQKSE